MEGVLNSVSLWLSGSVRAVDRLDRGSRQESLLFFGQDYRIYGISFCDLLCRVEWSVCSVR